MTRNGYQVNTYTKNLLEKIRELTSSELILPIWNHCTRAAAVGLIGLSFKGQVVVDLPAPLPTCGVFALYSIS